MEDIFINSKIFSSNYDILVFTETWLNINVNSAEIGLDDYNIFRDDRNPAYASRGGGVLIAVHKKFKCYVCKHLDYENTSVDHIYVNIKSGGISTIIGAIYIPPLADISVYQDHIMCIDDLKSFYSNSNFIILGDYNLPSVNWIDNKYILNSNATSYINNCCSILADSFMNIDLLQYSDIKNNCDNVLDLCFSNCKPFVSESIDPICRIDSFHPALDINVNCSFNYNCNFDNLYCNLSYYFFKKCNYKKINELINNVDRNLRFDHLDSIKAVQIFYDVINNIISQCVPKFKIVKSSFPVWFSKELKSLIFNKKIAHKKYKITKKFTDYSYFCYLRNRCKLVADDCFNSYVINVQDKLKHNPQEFWKFIHNKRKTKGIPSFIHYKNESADDKLNISNLFSKFFSSVHSSNDSTGANINFNLIQVNCKSNNTLNDLNASFFNIQNAIHNLKYSSRAGPDGIPAVFLKNCCNSLLKQLYILFNFSIQTGFMHPVWKTFFANPILKKGSVQDVENYRPIALMSAISKIFDAIISDKVKTILGDLISERQHGFTNGKSVVSNLSIYSNFIFSCFENKSQVDAAYFDFIKLILTF